MKKGVTILITALLLLFSMNTWAQSQQSEIDSLVNKMRTTGREWNNYAEPLIKIGEPAVPVLIKNARDTSLSQWNRRILMVTLNKIHSKEWVKPALEILFDENETPEIRNRATAGLSGFDLSHVNTELWELFGRTENQFHKSNIANLLLNADTALAYKAFYELYQTEDGFIQKNALQKLVFLRPNESTYWYLKAMQGEDWMTANFAMDSLINSTSFEADKLLQVYANPEMSEEIQWRIINVFGQRNDSESIPFLCEALKNKSWLVHTEAAVSLIRFDKSKVCAELEILKNDSSNTVRNNVEWIVAQLQEK